MSEQGQRLNIRKATLREWRSELARHLRTQGIDANATERAVRGENRTHKTDGIYRAALRGDSTHIRARVEAVAQEVLTDGTRPEVDKSKVVETRKEVEVGWRAVGDALLAQGQPELAAQVQQFVQQMTPPRTEKELLATRLRERAHQRRERERSPFVR
jgi:hypothetical protein